jgi:hypothetical protein
MEAQEIKTEVVPLTLELAKRFDRMAVLKGDRDPDTYGGRRRVAFLHGILAAGLFHSPEWSVVYVQGAKGKKYRIDGGHSARMLVQSGANFPEGMMVTIREFSAATILDAVDLYAQFNQAASTRTKTDLIKNKAAYVNELDGVSCDVIRVAIGGIAYFYRLTAGYKCPNSLDFIREHPAFIQTFADCLSIRCFKHKGIVAAMFVMWQMGGHRESRDFWLSVREETGRKDHGPRMYSRWLLEAQAKLAKTRTVPIGYTSRAYYVRACHAWNAWRTKQPTCLRYMPRAELPAVI